MATSGPNSPGTVVNTSAAAYPWSNPSNATTSNNSYATATPIFNNRSDFLDATNFGFSIPTGAIISSISCDIESKSTVSSSNYTIFVYLIKGGSTQSTYKAQGHSNTSDTYYTYSPLLWDGSISASDINASNFGVRIYTSIIEARTVSIDHVRVTITYTCSPPVITTTTLAADYGIKNVAYSKTLASSGGSTPQWTLTAGSLPTGLSLSTGGVISGTPTVAESQTFTVTLTNTTCDTSSDSQELTLIIADTKTGSDLVSSVTETGTVTKTTYDYSIANNNIAYVLNTKTGGWTKETSCPFSKAIYRITNKTILGSRRDLGQVSVINAGETFDGTTITWTYQTGFYNFGSLDEMKSMPDNASESIKRLRALFSDVKSAGNITLTIFTENDSTGQAFTITPVTTDNTVYNMVRTALSRAIRGKYVSFRFSSTSDAWIGEQSVKIAPRAIR